MRILKVTETYAPFLEHGGPPVKVRALAEGLARRGHKVAVVTADWGVAARHELVEFQRGRYGRTQTANRVEATYLPTWLRYRTLTWNPAIWQFCRERLGEFDVVHIYGLYDLLGPAVAKACRAARLPYVLEPIGMFVPIVRNLWLKRMYHEFSGRAMIRGARALIATSEQEISELIAGGIPTSRIVLRRNGVEPPLALPPRGTLRAKLGIAPEAKLILFLGRLVRKKSPDLLLRAFATLPSQLSGSATHMVFAGPDEDGMTEQLRQLSAELGVEDRVHCIGPVFGEEKWAAYRDANFFVLPSQNENFGNAAAEAVAVGTPVIVTENCGIAPLLEGAAGLVVPHDVGALARALERLLTDPALYSKLATGCAAVLPRLGWRAPIEEMESLYARLARVKPGIGESAVIEDGL